MKKIILIYAMILSGCTTTNYTNTATNVDINKFMGKWYVLAGRFTFLETKVHNAVEAYTWNETENRIDVDFTYNYGSLTGKQKSIGQKAWIENIKTNAHWKISPFWPLKLDYLIVDVASDYSWTAIGVPSQKYLWIMAKSTANSESVINTVIKNLEAKGYNTTEIEFVPHNK